MVERDREARAHFASTDRRKGTSMPASLRDGPALTVRGSCDGCRHFGHKPIGLSECMFPGSWRQWAQDTTETPAWCPRLPAARLALGRMLVEEGE